MPPRIANRKGDSDRWLALGLLLAALGLVYFVLIHPVWTKPMGEANAKIERLRERELQLRTQLLQQPEVEKRLQQVRAAQGANPGFLAEANAQLATAGLVQRLETVVQQASPGNRSCQIQNRSPLAEQGRDRFPKVTVQVRMRCGVRELANVLYAVESGSPRLFVGNLNILANRYFFSANDPRGANAEGGLDVSFDLYGYLRPAAGAAAPAAEVTRAP